ncbi:glycerate kinase [Rhodoferax sp.]|uniref:glycerate kinase n=1 Tax=Rhodoferax sp. TaxID=50421 RepID=UPI00274A2FFE|nr:glycerate kinase [Rhodoferax sp.]
MQFQKILIPVGSVVLVVAAYRGYGWAGVAVAGGALVMWLLLHFTRMMQVLKRASNRPIGFVDSAVMLNAKLRSGVTLLHVVAMTRSLGELTSSKDSQPECYRWTDGSQSWVDCEFHAGKLRKWAMVRPAATTADAEAPTDATAAPSAP